MSVNDWRDLERHSRDSKHEYIDGQVHGPGDEVELRSIDVHFPLAALYKRTTVPEILNAPENEV
jgi:hypothetical protein